MSKAFKSVRSLDMRPAPHEILDVARGFDPSLPPAAVTPSKAMPAAASEVDDLVQLNVRVGSRLADWLADKAAAEGVSQKVWICRALQAAGAPVHPSDLQDKTIRRRRGTAR